MPPSFRIYQLMDSNLLIQSVSIVTMKLHTSSINMTHSARDIVTYTVTIHTGYMATGHTGLSTIHTGHKTLATIHLSHDTHLWPNLVPVDEGSEGMMICEGHKVQFWETPRGSQVTHPLPILITPARGVDMAVVSQVVHVLYQTTTEADLQVGQYVGYVE